MVALNLLATLGVWCRGGANVGAAFCVRASGAAGFATGLGASFVAARNGVAGRGAWFAGRFAAAASAAARRGDAGANNALNPAPFGRWTLRDKAAQRRLA